MATARTVLRRYPIVALTVVVGVVGLVLSMTDAAAFVPWMISLFALAVAAQQAVRMLRSLARGEIGLDILAVTAILATVAVGEYWASLVIVLMLSGGEALEDYAAGRAKRELNALLSRVPQQAHRMLGDTQTEDIPAEEVEPGDLLLIRPAEIVPVDGQLESAAATVDESSLTGESLPVDRHRGDLLLSGSVNGPSAVRIRATARAADSQYQRIVALVQEASSSKAPIVRLADRYALPFTLLAYALAGVAWWVSGDPHRFAEVLVVATPCPLLIAAPVAFMAGMSRSAKAGVVVKNAGTLEKLARARTVAFDKTGTLTHGTPTVLRVTPANGYNVDELLTLVASAEQYSSHVVAASLTQTAVQRGLVLRSATSAREVATNGVDAVIDGTDVVVGKPAFVAARTDPFERVALGAGEMAVYVGIGDRYAGSIVLRDTLRAEAGPTLAALATQGVRKTMMLTGDVASTAQHIADEIGITDVQAECLPEDKVRIVKAAQPRPVIMVGDGVNDAPVLAVADVGIAMGAKGSTAASESADVVILLDDLSRVARAVDIGQRTVLIALQSIWIGIALSVVLMVIAAFGLLPAIVGASLQEVVDLVTILNALRALTPGRKSRTVLGGIAPRGTQNGRSPQASAVSVINDRPATRKPRP
ncbi:heavy metal translocating P-type ATPase [Salinibacterium sp. ZJ454]|uniref:heavy metal translocating P-type ATPase n=1 Tax=Salinibacterium sp. ZJ454 TaxID=2708339 RepID=UPI001423E89E|nr:heavy metal translocating P-type ATPase [Salinibacterium sp. ZJ454]